MKTNKMKKWYHVFYQYFDITNRQWCLGRMNFIKFIITYLYFKFHSNTVDNIENFEYVSPKQITYV